jgi:integrase
MMSGEEVGRILAATPEVAPVALVIPASTGARRFELAALKWADLEGSTLKTDGLLLAVWEGCGETPMTEVRDQPTKTRDRRRVALDPETLTPVATGQEHLASITQWMFTDTERPPHPDRVGYWWQRARTISGVDSPWRLHDLRRWSATSVLSGGYDLATVARRIGHSDPFVSLWVYSHALDDRDVEQSLELSRAWSPDEH